MVISVYENIEPKNTFLQMKALIMDFRWENIVCGYCGEYLS